MKFLRRIIIVLAVLCLLPFSVLAAESSVTVQHEPNAQPASGVIFQLYPVESAIPNAPTAYVYVIENSLQPVAEGQTDENGQVAFSGLSDGTYLLVGRSHPVGSLVCEVQMSLLTLPGEDGATYITVQTKYTLKDPAAVEPYKVIVIWEGDPEDQPESVEVYVWKNEELEETVTLTRDNNWQYSWEEDDPEDIWAVSAAVPEDYTVTYDREANVFIVRSVRKEGVPGTPTEPTDPSGPNLPQTGQLWWPVPVLAILGMLMILIGWVRRKESRNEG